ncbi:hypothetical protein [Acinetobacter haemolyticus]|uniref:hypothetical protein n=1 Tax=Acinetobacter haemolyticus TaxID=29430 RepID=UPI003AF73C92
MNNLSPETIQEMAGIRREAAEDLTNLVFLLGIATEKLKVISEQFTYLGPDFHDLKVAIRIAKCNAEITRDYHNSEAFMIEGKLEKVTADEQGN